LGLTMVVVTHELESIKTICDKLTFLSNGNVIFDGDLQGAREKGSEEIQRFFARAKTESKEGSENIKFNFET